MKVTEAIARSEILHTRIVALETAIFKLEQSQGFSGYARQLTEIKAELEEEAEEIKLKLEQIEFK